jgi:hypothetical protein
VNLGNMYVCMYFRTNESIAWPPRNPGLSILDYLSRMNIKNIVYSKRIRDLTHIRRRINAATETVTPEMLTHVCSEAEHRFDVCRVLH